MTFATNLLATARRLIEAYGQSISFARVVEGSFVPSTGAVGAGTSSSYTAYGAPMQYSSREIDNVTVMTNDVLIWVEVNASSSIPIVGDVATLSTIAHRILDVQKLVAQGTTVVYKLQARI
jgi:hypothetical protein